MPNTSCMIYMIPPANIHNPNSFNSFCTTSKAVEAEDVTAVIEPAELSPSIERRSQPAQPGETFDGPPTLERSGSERRGGAVSSLFPEGERVGVRGGALFNGKEGRGDYRKKSFLSKEERGVSIVHTLQSPHNILAV